MIATRQALVLVLTIVTVTVTDQLSAQTRITERPQLPGALTILSGAQGPQNVAVNGTQVAASVFWNPPYPGRGYVYSVQRWMESNPACCYRQVNALPGPSWLDEGVQWPGTYVYRVTVFHSDGGVGSTDVKWTRPEPVNPTNFRARIVSPGNVELRWDAVDGVSWYELFGPALPFESFAVTPPMTVYLFRNLAPGTYTWRIGSYYGSPTAPVRISTSAHLFPQVTVTVPP